MSELVSEYVRVCIKEPLIEVVYGENLQKPLKFYVGNQKEGTEFLLSGKSCIPEVFFSKFWKANPITRTLAAFSLFFFPSSTLLNQEEAGLCTPGRRRPTKWPKARSTRSLKVTVDADTSLLLSAPSWLHRYSPASTMQHLPLCEPWALLGTERDAAGEAFEGPATWPGSEASSSVLPHVPCRPRRSPDTCKLRISLCISAAEMQRPLGLSLLTGSRNGKDQVWPDFILIFQHTSAAATTHRCFDGCYTHNRACVSAG